MCVCVCVCLMLYVLLLAFAELWEFLVLRASFIRQRGWVAVAKLHQLELGRLEYFVHLGSIRRTAECIVGHLESSSHEYIVGYVESFVHMDEGPFPR